MTVTNIASVRKQTGQKMRGGTDEPPKVDPNACIAPGCPLRWSCDMGKGRLCSWHDRAPRRDWPTVTAELVDVLAAGKAPTYPTIPQAEWVRAAAQNAAAARKNAPPGGASLADRLPVVRSSRDRARQYADELGIDVGHES